MSQQPRKDPPNSPAPPATAGDERKSGRVQFDERGQAVWEWAVQTGMFDRNASTQRIRALTEGPGHLTIAETPNPAQKPAETKAPTGNPYERAAVPRSAARHSAGGDPYSRGPARKPESMTFNPHERNPVRKP
jgi:hypothetical protein